MAWAGSLDSEQKHIVPHARTLRNARLQVQQMVIDGLSANRIKSYLRRWCYWWVKSSQNWAYQELLEWFLHVCRDVQAAAYAVELLHDHTIKTAQKSMPTVLNAHAIA